MRSALTRSRRTALLDLGLLVVVASGIRAVYLGQLAATPLARHLVVDEASYDRWARAIAGGELLGTNPFYQAPLYPYVLGGWYFLFGTDPWAVRIVQAVAGVISVVLLYRIGRQVFGRLAGWVAGLGAALYAPFLLYEGMILKETWAILLTNAFLLALLWAMRTRLAGWAVAGFSLGLLALLRENALAYLPCVIIYILARRPTEEPGPRPWRVRWSQAGLLTAGTLAALAPAMIHNVAAGGGVLLTTYQGGTNFYIGNHPGATGVYTPIRPGRESPRFEGLDAEEEAEHRAGRDLTPGEVSRFWFAEGLRFGRERPAEFLGLQLRKLAITVNAREIPDTWDIQFVARLVPVLRGPLLRFGWMAPLGLLGLALAYPWRAEIGLLALLALATTFSVALFYVFARYRLPLAPLLLVFAGSAVARGWEALRTGRTRQLAAGAAALIPLALLVHLDLARFGLTFTDEVGHQNLGFVYLRDGRADLAEAEFSRAIAINPDLGNAWLQRARLQEASGRTEDQRETLEGLLRHAARRRPEGTVILDPAQEAEAHARLAGLLRDAGELRPAAEHFAAAAAFLPEDPRALIQQGITLRLLGSLDDAADAYAEALRRDPGNPLALYNLANVEVDRGDPSRALRWLREAEVSCVVSRPDLCEPIRSRLRGLEGSRP